MDKKRNAAIWTGIALVITLVLGYLLIADIGLPGGRPLTTLSPRGDKSQNIQDLIIPVLDVYKRQGHDDMAEGTTTWH